MAALGFVHVMRRDEHGQTIGGELMNLVPKFAARFRIHARRRLVEQQQLRFVNQTRGQREPLFPSAGQSSGQLPTPLDHAETFQTFFDGVFAIGDAVNARDEFQIFGDGQIFIERKFLRHVADAFFDFGGLAAEIEAEATAFAAIGFEQAAEHPQKRRLAAAIRAEETVNLAVPHLHGDVVDDGALPEFFRDAAHVNDEVAVHSAKSCSVILRKTTGISFAKTLIQLGIGSTKKQRFMKTVTAIVVCLIVFKCNFSTAQETNKTPDAIDWLVAELGSSGNWQDGIVTSLNLPETASSEEIVSNAFKKDWFYKIPADYKILESRKIEFPFPHDKYLAALVETGIGQKIIIYEYAGREVGWFRIYDAPKSFTLDERGNPIWSWLEYPYARGSERHFAFVEIESISDEQTTFRESPNSKVSDDDGKAWYNLLHVRSGMATCKVIECPDAGMPTNITVYFERAGYVPTRETPSPWTDQFVQPKARLLGFFTQRDGKWNLGMSQFYDPVSELLESDGKRLQALFKTPLASEDALAKRKQLYEEARIRAQQRVTNNAAAKQN